MDPPDSRLVELPWQPRPRTGVATVSVLIAAVAAASIVLLITQFELSGSVWQALTSPVGSGALLAVALTGAVVTIATLIDRRRLRRALRAAGSRPPAEVLAMALDAPVWFGDPLGALRAALETLHRTGAIRGLAFAALRPTEAGQIRPIESAFEPVPLDEADARFEELRAAAEQDGSPPVRSLSARGSRRMLMRLLPVLAMLPGLLILSAAGAWRFVAVLLVVLIAVAGLSLVLSWLAPTQGRSDGLWQLVPAGVLVLRPAGSRWRPTLLTARDAAVVCWPATSERSRWHVCIGSSEASVHRRITPLELRMLLAAWLSPLEPPKPEQLSDLSPM